jgi:hypothetical protein
MRQIIREYGFLAFVADLLAFVFIALAGFAVVVLASAVMP